ncbi:MFS transporter [Rhodococcus sp. KBS0724]|uniref:MFS transporter n=1 Tax=Rhodococcus sp. KBS0724 TaxID=1179674 RepID=UPI0021B11FB4|nr:MFS transporter [Rhodococcus sp. KBS0724]
MNDPKLVSETTTTPRIAENDTSLGRHSSGHQLPWSALLAMAATAFIVIMTETLPAGLLLEISDGLVISEAAAGQLISAYALGAVLCAIPAIALTRGYRRKPILIVAVSGFVVANTLTAVAPDFAIALGARFVAGAFSGMVWGMLAGYARKISPPAVAGTALTVAMAGTPVAFALGTPLATFLGTVTGWRATFVVMSVAAVALIVWIISAVPDASGQNRTAQTPLRRVVLIPGVGSILAVVLGWFLAHNVLYTYISPIIEHLDVGIRVDVALAIFGVASLAGLGVTGVLVDRMLRPLVLSSLTIFAVSTAILATLGSNPIIFVVSVVLWGMSFGGAAPLLQTALADASGPDADVANSMLTTVANLAIFGGGALGGIALGASGPGFFPFAALVMIVVVIIVVVAARVHGFVPGQRNRT